MTRVAKPADVRRQEILHAAVDLFAAKGYAATTVNDILDRVGIAKGTFYHHFSSKEAVMRAVVLQVGDEATAQAEAIAADETQPPPDRILAIIASQRLAGDRAALIDALHEAGNAEFHLLSLTATVNRLTPIIADVVRQGIADGQFDTPYPEEAVAILLSAASFLTDEGFEGYQPDQKRVIPALLVAAERLFGAEAGTFLKALDQFESAEPSPRSSNR